MVEQAKVEVIASPQFRGEADLPGALQNIGGTAPDDSSGKTTTPPTTTPPAGSSSGTTNGTTTHDGHLDARHAQRPGRRNRCGEA